MGAYFLYSNEVRDTFRTKYPEKKLGEISKTISEAYRELSDRERQAYEDKAKKMKEDYDKEVAAYVSKHGSLPKKERKSPEHEDKKRAKTNSDDKRKIEVKAQGKEDDKKGKGKSVANAQKEKK